MPAALRDMRLGHATIGRLPFDAAEVEQGVPARFEKVAAFYARHHAVETEAYRWTYAELNRQANHVAHTLLAQRGDDAQPVALLMAFDAPVVAAVLGALKAGLFYSALDPAQPEARLRALLDDLTAPWLLTDAQHLAQAERLAPPGCGVVLVDPADHVTDAADRNPDAPVTGDDYLAVLYTSGSSGPPKGVIRRHRGLLHRAWQEQDELIDELENRTALLALPVTGGDTTRLLKAVLSGVTILPFDLKRRGAVALADWLDRQRVTAISPPIALLRQLWGLIEPNRVFTTLRLVSLGGDIVYRRDVEILRRHVRPDCAIVCRYGSSETSRIAQFRVPDDLVALGETVPVGFPVPGQEVLILDENGQPVAAGAVGEVAVRSRYIAAGYWRRPALTDERFIPDPATPDRGLYLTGDLGRFRPDGMLELAGRRDFQVKIRGSRVGLSSVESALLTVPGVAQAVVIARPDHTGEDQLVAYLVTTQPDLTVGDVRAYLAARLPDYAVPSAYVLLDALPLTPHHKVDRRALPPPPRLRPRLAVDYVAPATPTETLLARLWAEVLGLDRVGAHDSFLDLGGHSLLASQLVARVNRALQLDLPLRALFQAATVAEMAALIEALAPPSPPPERLIELIDEIERLSEVEAEQRLALAPGLTVERLAE